LTISRNFRVRGKPRRSEAYIEGEANMSIKGFAHMLGVQQSDHPKATTTQKRDQPTQINNSAQAWQVCARGLAV
jgi:hypothetical protein